MAIVKLQYRKYAMGNKETVKIMFYSQPGNEVIISEPRCRYLSHRSLFYSLQNSIVRSWWRETLKEESVKRQTAPMHCIVTYLFT